MGGGGRRTHHRQSEGKPEAGDHNAGDQRPSERPCRARIAALETRLDPVVNVRVNRRLHAREEGGAFGGYNRKAGRWAVGDGFHTSLR